MWLYLLLAAVLHSLSSRVVRWTLAVMLLAFLVFFVAFELIGQDG
jgi:hypothetical protein